MHLETAANLCASRPDVKKILKSGNVFRVLEKTFIVQEKRFMIAKTYQINRRENLNILCLQAFNLAPKMGRPRSATRPSIAVAG